MNLPRYIIDTHALLWFILDPDRLSERSRTIIISGENEVFVSAVAIWEITIKVALGRLGLEFDVAEAVNRTHLSPLAITLGHAAAVGTLPPHHRDPFDRMLVAQAQCEELTLITRDRELQKYDIDLLVA